MRTSRVPLAVIVTAGFALRLAVGLWRGEAAFTDHGYTMYLDIARTWLDGHGLCLEPGVFCARRPPVYSLIVAAFLSSGWLYPGLVILQSAVGAVVAWLAAAIGRELFDARVGVLAAAATAFNPYAVIHDTALQDTVVFNALLALSVLLLIRTATSPRAWVPLGAGLVLALATLTTARLTLFVPLAVVAAACAGATVSLRLRRAALVALPVAALLGGWVVRNWQVVGAPVLTTTAGKNFWIANSESTFDYFPERSIDLNGDHLRDRLSDLDKARVDVIADNEAARDRLFRTWGLAYVSAHPRRVSGYAVRKVWSAASAQLSPARGGLVQAVYLLTFAPVHLLAAIGLWRARGRPGVHAPVYLLLAAFTITTAVYWAHTSHKNSLDVFLFVYAMSAAVSLPAVARWCDRLIPEP